MHWRWNLRCNTNCINSIEKRNRTRAVKVLRKVKKWYGRRVCVSAKARHIRSQVTLSSGGFVYLCVPVPGYPKESRCKGIKVDRSQRRGSYKKRCSRCWRISKGVVSHAYLCSAPLCRIHTCIQRLISKPLRGEYNLKPDLTRVTFLRLPQVFCFKTLISAVEAFLVVLTLFNHG